MIIKVTRNESISSVHIDSVQNPIKLFNLLKTILQDDIDIFTEPNIKEKEGIIEWTTEIEGEKISYDKADDETKHIIKGLLRDKVYKIIENRDETQIELLKKVLQIPDESDIYLVDNQIRLTNWGHIKNSYDAREDIVFDLIGDISTLLKIEVVKDGVKLTGYSLTLSWDNGEKKIETDEFGLAKEFVPINKEIKIYLECDSKEIEEYIKTSNLNEYKLIDMTIPPSPQQPIDNNKEKERKRSFWLWLAPLLLLLLILLGWIGYNYNLFNSSSENRIEEEKDIKIEIIWNGNDGDFDLHLIDSCGNLVDNIRRSSECKNKKIEFVKQSQGFDCEDGICKEIIVAPNGIEGKIKIIINKYSSKSNSSNIKMVIKRGDEMVISRDFTISIPHPMLKKIEPNSNDIVLEWGK